MKENGQGRPEKAPTAQKNAPLKEQGSPKVASEAGNDYIGILNSIRAEGSVLILLGYNFKEAGD